MKRNIITGIGLGAIAGIVILKYTYYISFRRGMVNASGFSN